jgi:hypothetical protein
MEKEKEIEELEDELRPEYDFAQRQGGIRGRTNFASWQDLRSLVAVRFS